jgi:hypothetical protein
MKRMNVHEVNDMDPTPWQPNDVVKVYTGRILTRMDDQNRPEQYPESILMIYRQAVEEFGESLKDHPVHKGTFKNEVRK